MLIAFSVALAIRGSALSAPALCAASLFPPAPAGRLVSGPDLLPDWALVEALGRIDPVPGAWAEYLVLSRRWGEARVRVTVLRAAQAAVPEGRYWLEVALANASGVAGAARLLVHAGSSSSDVERLSLLLAGQQPIEIPLEQLAPERQRRPLPKMARLGSARVRVRAGAFTAEVLRVAGTRVWRAQGVPLWGLVKASSRSLSVELLASGTSGGRSVFSGPRDQGNGSDSAK